MFRTLFGSSVIKLHETIHHSIACPRNDRTETLEAKVQLCWDSWVRAEVRFNLNAFPFVQVCSCRVAFIFCLISCSGDGALNVVNVDIETSALSTKT